MSQRRLLGKEADLQVVTGWIWMRKKPCGTLFFVVVLDEYFHGLLLVSVA